LISRREFPSFEGWLLPAFFIAQKGAAERWLLSFENIKTSMAHFLLEIFSIIAKCILGPMAIAWLTAKLNNKPKV
jgi:hypothetical protein